MSKIFGITSTIIGFIVIIALNHDSNKKIYYMEQAIAKLQSNFNDKIDHMIAIEEEKLQEIKNDLKSHVSNKINPISLQIANLQLKLNEIDHMKQAINNYRKELQDALKDIFHNLYDLQHDIHDVIF